ncbi:NADP-dependent oxidoreductase [Catellatospora sichuanensis]|uniref:NADP-dependent oxidoreductase n=1 Tax=Catellatospora sichuanensis TaxID=1969805 RepID=UPI001184645F|nr:NADP-dependent oxidoreductase [Catellatospora sichuanensis]
MSAHMRAMRQQTLGGPEVLTPAEVERPVPGPTEVLVEVHAAGVNPVDWNVRRHGLFLTPPFTVGWDVSGVVAAVGAGVTRFQPGDEVYGMPHFPRAAGAYAEYVAAPSRHFARKPVTLSHVEAAALPLAGLTAWQALVDTAGVRAGDRVLVHAAAGGVGHLAVQIAKARGAYVVATASGSRHDLLRGWGADVCVDYRTTDFTGAVRDMDVVLDTVGGDYEERSLSVLRPGGLLVSIVAVFAAQRLAAKAREAGRRAVTLLVEPDHAGLTQLAALADGGQLKPLVADVFPLAEAGRAHELGERGRTAGKIVLTLAR